MYFSAKLLSLIAATASILSIVNASTNCGNDKTFKFLANNGNYKGCGWLKNNHARQGRYCEKETSDGVHIGTACAESCNKCASSCGDVQTFTFFNDDHKSVSCDWLTGDESKTKLYCPRPCAGFDFIGNACPKSCNWCPTPAPTPALSPAPITTPTVTPTVTPTRKPSIAPIATSPTSCGNDVSYRFIDDEHVAQTCEWLTDSAMRKDKYCNRVVHGVSIGEKCVKACDHCNDETDSPTKSPVCDPSPSKGSTSPNGGSPSKGSANPSKGKGSPSKGSANPSKGYGSPSKGSANPSKGSMH